MYIEYFNDSRLVVDANRLVFVTIPISIEDSYMGTLFESSQTIWANS